MADLFAMVIILKKTVVLLDSVQLMEVGLIGQSGTTVIGLVILDEEEDKDGAIIQPQNITGEYVRGMLLRQFHATPLHARMLALMFTTFLLICHGI